MNAIELWMMFVSYVCTIGIVELLQMQKKSKVLISCTIVQADQLHYRAG